VRYLKNYISVLVLVSISTVVGFKLLWYFFMVDSYRPEWFLLIMGLVFIAAGIWVSREWFRLHRAKMREPVALKDIASLQVQFGLSRAEKDILELLANGLSNSEIAEARNTSINTVKTHISNIYQKTGVKSRTQMLAIIKNRAENP
jgi:DNA-binding CsgD family transcriptional regulator